MKNMLDETVAACKANESDKKMLNQKSETESKKLHQSTYIIRRPGKPCERAQAELKVVQMI